MSDCWSGYKVIKNSNSVDRPLKFGRNKRIQKKLLKKYGSEQVINHDTYVMIGGPRMIGFTITVNKV